MKIAHLALWVEDLEASKSFYETYFGAQAGDRYHNPTKQFTSYFLSFEGSTQLELMHRPNLPKGSQERGQTLGLAHFAISVGSKEKVDALTEQLRADGFKVVGEARTTGDGYYESVVLDPEDNTIEITI